MNSKKDIDHLRAEAIAELLLLKSPVDLEIIREKDQDVDFVVRLPNSQARIAIQVKRSRNLKRELEKTAKMMISRKDDNFNLLPIVLIVVDSKEVNGELALLSNWNSEGKLELNITANLVPYSEAYMAEILTEVVRKFDATHALAS